MFGASKKVAIDLGSSTVKVAELAKTSDGLQLVRYAVVNLRLNPSVPADKARQVRIKGMLHALRTAQIKTKNVVVGIPGQVAFIRNIKLPPIPEAKINQIVKYEIQQQIPFPLEEIALDYHVLRADGTDEVEVVMVAMKGDTAESFSDQITDAKLKPGIIDSNPLAIYNCFSFNNRQSKGDCTAIIDIGASTTSVLIEADGELRFTRCISIAGNEITAAIQNTLDISFEKAEKLKLSKGLWVPEDTEEKPSDRDIQVSEAIQEVLGRLVGEIKLSLGYFRSHTGISSISRAIISGGTAQLKNIRPFLADRLGVEVEFLKPFRKISVPKSLAKAKRSSLVMGTCLGMALRDSAPCPVEISIVPPRVARVRQRRVQMLFYVMSLIMFGGILYTFIPARLNKYRLDLRRVRTLDKKINVYKASVGDQPSLKDQYSNLESQRESLINQRAVYEAVAAMRWSPLSPMVAVSKKLKNTLWLTSYNTAIVEGIPLTTISGYCRGETLAERSKTLTNFLFSFEDSFDNAELTHHERVPQGIYFTIELTGTGEGKGATPIGLATFGEEGPAKEEEEEELFGGMKIF